MIDQDLAIVESATGEDWNSPDLIDAGQIVRRLATVLRETIAEEKRVARVLVVARSPREWAPFDPEAWADSKALAVRKARLDAPTVLRGAE